MATASALSKERFALLFAVMLVAAAGNTAMQSLMPAIGRALRIADIWVAVAFSLSAIVWVLIAPHWARRADHRGRRALMRLGLYGFIVSMLICGGVLAAGLHGLIPAAAVFPVFILGRAIYGGWGSASPSAVQAYVAAESMYGITLGFALASLGFGFFRPGFTSGASLAVAPHEQNAVAGMVTSVNGVAYIAAPAAGVALYGLWMPLPFLVTAAAMALLALWAWRRLGR